MKMKSSTVTRQMSDELVRVFHHHNTYLVIPLSAVTEVAKQKRVVDYIYTVTDMFGNTYYTNETVYEAALKSSKNPLTIERIQKCLELMKTLGELKQTTTSYISGVVLCSCCSKPQ